MREAIRNILIKIGENPDRESLLKTPERVEESLLFLTKGYRESIDDIIKDSLYTESYDEMVLITDIDVYSLCEHHLLPFYGVCHVGYIPNGKVIGLSKIPRIIEVFSRRLQIQERLTSEIAETLQKYLNPQGVAVVMEARHMCMIMRGVEQTNSIVTTSSMLGVFREDERTRMEFLNLLKSNSIK